MLNKDNNRSQEKHAWYGTQKSQLNSWWLMMMTKTHHSTFGIWETPTIQLLLSRIFITMESYQHHGASLTQTSWSLQLRIIEQLLWTSRLVNRSLSSLLNLSSRRLHGLSLLRVKSLRWILKATLKFSLSSLKDFSHNLIKVSQLLRLMQPLVKLMPLNGINLGVVLDLALVINLLLSVLAMAHW